MPEEFWIAIDQSTDVVDRAGDKVISHLTAGTISPAIGSNEHWFMIPLPDGATGFVPRTKARIVDGPPPKPSSPPPEPVATASAASQPSPSPATPAARPPAQPPTGPPRTGGSGRGKRGWIIALVVVLIGAAGAFYLLRDDTLVLAEGEVFLEQANDPGPEAFTTSLDVPDAPEIVSVALVVATVTTTSTAADTAGPPGGAALPTVSGAEPGLYGGTQDASRCDPSQLVAFLNNNPDKAGAWIQGINAGPNFQWSGGSSLSVFDIPAFVAELTPITLVADTRITNNGYRNGVPSPRQAVLQAGTSVLVDTFGVPRVKCNCGNPLAPPVAQTGAVTYTGDRWDTFQPDTTVVVQPSPAPLPVIELVDIFTGELIDRPVGTTGEADIPTGVTVSAPLVFPGSTTVVTASSAATTTSMAPSVLSSGDFCVAYIEYVEIDNQYADQYDDPNSVPEYRAFVMAALSDLANIAPDRVKADWEWIRDQYESNLEFEEAVGLEAEERFARIFEHLEDDCGLDIFDL